MIIGRTVTSGDYGSFYIQSNEHATIDECVRDIVPAMDRLAQFYPTVRADLTKIGSAFHLV